MRTCVSGEKQGCAGGCALPSLRSVNSSTTKTIIVTRLIARGVLRSFLALVLEHGNYDLHVRRCERAWAAPRLVSQKKHFATHMASRVV